MYIKRERKNACINCTNISWCAFSKAGQVKVYGPVKGRKRKGGCKVSVGKDQRKSIHPAQTGSRCPYLEWKGILVRI